MSSTKSTERLNSFSFSARLERLLEGKGKAEFARSIGILPQQLSRYLKGRVPDLKTLLKIAAATEKSVEWLVTGEETGQTPSGAMMVAEQPLRYNTRPDLSVEEGELVDMLLAVLRGRNRENVEAIKSNIKAFHKSREMASEPLLPTQRKAAG